MSKTIDVTAAIIVKNNKILSARRRSSSHLEGYWEFPGGKMKEGETPEFCLKRELQEEFCIDAKIGAFFEENTHKYESITIRLLAYWVTHIAGEFKFIDHDQICWLTSSELENLNWAPADIPIVKHLTLHFNTMNFYSNNARDYCTETVKLTMDKVYDEFTAQLPGDAYVLDLGCGSGRDSRYFLEKGYKVCAIDGNAEIAEIAEQYIGQSVIVTQFQEIDFKDQFHGVWASASLLHCTRNQILKILANIVNALKENGVIFMSFKWGEGESIDDKSRYFNNFTESTLRSLLESKSELLIIKTWSDNSTLRGNEQKWVNALLKKKCKE